MAIPRFSNYISHKTGSPQAVLVSITIEGLGDTMKEMERIQNAGTHAMGRALYAEALLIMREAKRLTPVRFGILRASGHVTTPEVRDEAVNVELGFGGPAGIGNQGESNSRDVGYALPVHEDLRAHHKVGQAKYLEQPVLSSIMGMEQRLATRIKADLRL